MGYVIYFGTNIHNVDPELLDPRTKSIKGERVVLREYPEQSLDLRTGELKLVRDGPEYDAHAVLKTLAGDYRFDGTVYKPHEHPRAFKEVPLLFDLLPDLKVLAPLDLYASLRGGDSEVR
ncbi:hypothetical protein J4477_04570 [Candidatus Pacearchaeota archaeon]|nr:hypothetical protein [Candidatus Pacearchaeota archaeon]